jgi:hypothetical protein
MIKLLSILSLTIHCCSILYSQRIEHQYLSGSWFSKIGNETSTLIFIDSTHVIQDSKAEIVFRFDTLNGQNIIILHDAGKDSLVINYCLFKIINQNQFSVQMFKTHNYDYTSKDFRNNFIDEEIPLDVSPIVTWNRKMNK